MCDDREDKMTGIYLGGDRLQINKKVRSEWMNSAEIISKIGGAFGVFIGFSMLTFAELLYFGCAPLKSKRHINDLREAREDIINLNATKKIQFCRHLKKMEMKNLIKKNEIYQIEIKTQIALIKHILRSSGVGRVILAIVIIAFFLISIWFVYIIWIRSYSDPLILTLSNTKISTATVSLCSFYLK